MADPIPVPVRILRLPRGPDASGSRGFQRDRSREGSRCPEGSRDRSREGSRCPEGSRDRSREGSRCPEGSREGSREDPAALQAVRALLRERFLLLLGRARGRRARFSLCGGIGLDGDFGAADLHSGALQVDSLQTPLGVQTSALLRSGDLLEFSFALD